MASAGALYRNGKVNLVSGSKTIIGVKTLWQSAVNAIVPGDLFTLDMKVWYEVLSVVSDTELKVERGIEVGNSSNNSYGILRSTSGTTINRLAGQIAAQLNQKQLFLDNVTEWLNSSDDEVEIFDSEGGSRNVKTPAQMVLEHQQRIDNVDSLTGAVSAMTKSEFDTIRKNEIRANAGAGIVNADFDKDYEFKQVDGWQNKFKLKVNEILIDGIWHQHPDTMITLNDAPNGLQNIDLSQPDYPDIAAAIVAGGTSLSKSYLNQREIVIAVQKDIAVTAPNATNTVFIQDTDNHVYSDNGVLRQRVLSFAVERLPESVPCASKNNAWRDCKNAMSALGWTQTDIVGQWKKEDKIAVALTWVQRKNQGAGHPMNPHGCGRVVTVNVNAWVPWHNTSARKPLSIADCFTQYDGNLTTATGAVDDTTSGVGTLSGGPSLNGRWNSDGKYYDAIYASDVQDLRINVYKMDDAKVLFDYSNGALSGSLHGHESVPFTSVIISPSLTPQHVQWRLLADGTSNAYANNTVIPDLRGHVVGNRYRFHVDTGGGYTTIEGEFVEYTVGAGYQFRDSIVLSGDAAPSSDWNHVGDLRGLVLESEGDNHTSAFPIWTDIIGTPANIAVIATNLGVDGFYGTWIPVIPDGANREYKLTRKNILALPSLITTNNGASWSTVAGWNVVGSSNSTTASAAAVSVYIINYKTKANFTEDSINLPIKAIGKVWAGNRSYQPNGGALISSLIGKIPTNEIAPYNLRGFTIEGYQFDYDVGKFGISEAQGLPKHSTISLGGFGPAAKTIISLIEADGMMGLQFNFKEIITHQNSSGDDNNFQLTDGVKTLPDENGNYVKYGTHVHILSIPFIQGA